MAIAAALEADECRIYTDVDGVFTTDPRVVLNARRIDSIDYDEMLEMSSQGAKILHLRSVELARKFNVPLRVLSSFSPGQGTCITNHKTDSTMESPLISGIAFQRGEAKLSVLDIPNTLGAVAEILRSISDANISVDFIIQNTGSVGLTDLSFTISNDDYQSCFDVLSYATKKFSKVRIEGDNRIAKISIVGVGMRSHSGVTTLLLDTLTNKSIAVKMISTSEIKISVVVDEQELGVSALHDAFDLSVKEPQLVSRSSMKLAHI